MIDSVPDNTVCVLKRARESVCVWMHVQLQDICRGVHQCTHFISFNTLHLVVVITHYLPQSMKVFSQ